jgi:hypothetical protein
MTRPLVITLLVGCSAAPIGQHVDSGQGAVPSNPTGLHYHYVVNHITLPTNVVAAQSEGVDLDGDGRVDNHFGIGVAALAGAGFDLQATLDRAIADGSIILLVDLQTESFSTAADPACLTFYDGTQPSPSPCSSPSDTVCGQHLAGTGSFAVEDWQTHYYGSTTVPGSVVNGVFTGATRDPQIAWTHLELALIGPTPLTLTLRDTHVVASGLSAAGLGQLTVAGAIGYLSDWDDFSVDSVVGGLVPQLNTMIATTCTTLSSPPGCGCASGSVAAQIVSYFDTGPSDCLISDQEVDTSAFFAGDDLTLGGPWDGGVSFGVQLTAVPASFSP